MTSFIIAARVGIRRKFKVNTDSYALLLLHHQMKFYKFLRTFLQLGGLAFYKHAKPTGKRAKHFGPSGVNLAGF